MTDWLLPLVRPGDLITVTGGWQLKSAVLAAKFNGNFAFKNASEGAGIECKSAVILKQYGFNDYMRSVNSAIKSGVKSRTQNPIRLDACKPRHQTGRGWRRGAEPLVAFHCKARANSSS